MTSASGPDARPTSVLTSLRSLIPPHPIDYEHALLIAERQAAALLRLHKITSVPVPSEIITDLPHITVVHELTPNSGMSHFNGSHWIITLNSRDSLGKRRITLLHEYAHIIWHGHEHHLFTSSSPHFRYLQAEQAADHFAYNVLTPEQHLTNAWATGRKHIGHLAAEFGVSDYTILARLLQLRVWLPTHRRRDPHWSQLLAPITPQHATYDRATEQPEPERAP